MSPNHFALVLVFIVVVLTPVGQVILKIGMNQIGAIEGIKQLFSPGTLLALATNPYIIGGLVLAAFNFILWMGAMSQLNISHMYPIVGISYVILALIALVFLGEHISLLRWVGILVIVAGVFIVNYNYAG